jgi:hypothetical protein
MVVASRRSAGGCRSFPLDEGVGSRLRRLDFPADAIQQRGKQLGRVCQAEDERLFCCLDPQGMTASEFGKHLGAVGKSYVDSVYPTRQRLSAPDLSSVDQQRNVIDAVGCQSPGPVGKCHRPAKIPVDDKEHVYSVVVLCGGGAVGELLCDLIGVCFGKPRADDELSQAIGRGRCR